MGWTNTSGIIARPSVSSRKRRIAFLLKIAKKNSELNVKAHRYALRQLAAAKCANGHVTDEMFFAEYFALVERYMKRESSEQ
jgi:hypothetical protein